MIPGCQSEMVTIVQHMLFSQDCRCITLETTYFSYIYIERDDCFGGVFVFFILYSFSFWLCSKSALDIMLLEMLDVFNIILVLIYTFDRNIEMMAR
jgi:hypothetical protein